MQVDRGAERGKYSVFCWVSALGWASNYKTVISHVALLIFHTLRNGNEATGSGSGSVKEKGRRCSDNDPKFICTFMFSYRFISGGIQGLSQEHRAQFRNTHWIGNQLTIRQSFRLWTKTIIYQGFFSKRIFISRVCCTYNNIQFFL